MSLADHVIGRVWRRPQWWLLLGAVSLVHLLLQQRLADELARLDPQQPAMQRMQTVYTRQMAPAAPPPQPALRPATPTPRPVAAQAAAPAASEIAAPDAAASAAAADPATAVAAADGAASDAAVLTAAAATVSAAASAAAAPPPAAPASAALAQAARAASAPPAASAAAAPRTETLYGVAWPASTRLRYVLNGWYRGPVEGSAQVEWLRQGTHYQVHLDIVVGPEFAPLATRRMSSDGQITPAGLAPKRFEQETRQIIGSNRRVDIQFEPDAVRLATGQRVPSDGVAQDPASQFIQLIFLFTTRPELRVPGASVDFAFALPHRLDRWTYDIGPTERVDTPAGPVEAFHVKPRRAASKDAMLVQMWMAPQLQLMPVRIRIDHDAETWADLLLKTLPEQAGPS